MSQKLALGSAMVFDAEQICEDLFLNVCYSAQAHFTSVNMKKHGRLRDLRIET